MCVQCIYTRTIFYLTGFVRITFCICTFFKSGCENESKLSMWIYVLLGNILRGIGETPVQPLGISYIDDHALDDSAAFYIGMKCLPFCYWFIVIHRHHLSEQSLLDQKAIFHMPINADVDQMFSAKLNYCYIDMILKICN